MKLTVEGKTYQLSLDDGFGVKETIAIEEYTGLDIDLFGKLLDPKSKGKRPPGSRFRALAALVWVARTRAGERLGIDDVDFKLTTLDIEDDAEPPDPQLAVDAAAP